MNNDNTKIEKNNKKKLIIILIVFVVGIIMIGCGVYLIFNNSENEKVKAVPIEYSTIEDGFEKKVYNGMEISNYSVEKLEEYDLWLLHLTLKNTTDTTIDTNGIYKLTYYDANDKIINIATDRFMFKIEPNNELILGIGLEFDGSLLRNFTMERIED